MQQLEPSLLSLRLLEAGMESQNWDLDVCTVIWNVGVPAARSNTCPKFIFKGGSAWSCSVFSHRHPKTGREVWDHIQVWTTLAILRHLCPHQHHCHPTPKILASSHWDFSASPSTSTASSLSSLLTSSVFLLL